MSNEEQMRAEFESDAAPYGYDLTKAECGCCTYKQPTTNERWLGFVSATERLTQQLLEQAAQVEKMREALESCGVNDDPYGEQWYDEIKVKSALAISPSAALAAHDNEVAAKALEEAQAVCNAMFDKSLPHMENGNQCDDYKTGYADGSGDCGHAMQRLIDERRNGK